METIIGAFDDRETAQRAVERLVQAGFPREDVHVQEADGDAGAIQDDGVSTVTQDRWQGIEAEARRQDRGLFSSIGHFFTSVFGEDHPQDHAHMYSEAVRRGSSVVVVDAPDEQRAGEAATLLHGLGAIDIDDRADQWRAAGWSPQGQGVSAHMQDTPMQDTSMRSPVMEDSERPLAEAQEIEPRVGKREVEHGGVRVFQRVAQKPVREITGIDGGATQRTPEEERAFASGGTTGRGFGASPETRERERDRQTGGDAPRVSGADKPR